MTKHVIVAIDGPAASGKSTLARRLAARLGYLYIDSGAMYRAIALWACRLGVDLGDAMRLEQLAGSADLVLEQDGRVLLNGEDVSEAIRQPDVSQAASRVASLTAVRRALVDKQRVLGAARSVVMEGRDIGTVVFPNAEVKVFLEASDDVRAQRRSLELQEKGIDASAHDVRSELQTRDDRDKQRPDSPLVQAPDAVLVNTSDKTLDQVEEEVLKIVREKTSNGKEVHR